MDARDLFKPETLSLEEDKPTKKKNTTDKGKELRIRPVIGTSMYDVVFYPGGQVPKSLLGKYTSSVIAQKAIDNYLESRKR